MQELDGAEMLSAGDATAEGDGMDLNELLESMDQEPEETAGQGDEELPELSEEEMFGEAAAETEDCGTEDAGASPETVPETAAEDRQPEKPKRTSRRKKTDEQVTEKLAAGDSVEETFTGEETVVEDDSMELISVEKVEGQNVGERISEKEVTLRRKFSWKKRKNRLQREIWMKMLPWKARIWPAGICRKKCWEIYRSR